MTTLATIFDEAFLWEKERYPYGAWSNEEWAVYLGKPPSETTTRADCERFVHQRAREAAFAALLEAVERPNRATVGWLCDQMAEDGDAGKGEI